MHFSVITGVPDKLEANSLSFPFYFFNPQNGVLESGSITEEIFHGFQAKAWSEVNDSKWIRPVVVSRNQSVSSPYLKLSMPNLLLSSKKNDNLGRTIYALDFGIGHF